VGAALVLAMLIPSSALGSSGEITRAQVSADWSHASIAGMVDWTESCEVLGPVERPRPPRPPEGQPEPPGAIDQPPPSVTCTWIPYATVGPVSPGADCSSPSRLLLEIGDGVQVVWWGDERSSVGSAAFDLPDVLLLHGESAPLLCLSAVEVTAEEIPCVPPGPETLPGWHCPYEPVYRYRQFDSALFEPVAPIVDRPPSSSGGDASGLGGDASGDLHPGESGIAKHGRPRCRRGKHRAKPGHRLESQRLAMGKARCQGRHLHRGHLQAHRLGTQN
jgi:hypothetical protein